MNTRIKAVVGGALVVAGLTLMAEEDTKQLVIDAGTGDVAIAEKTVVTSVDITGGSHVLSGAGSIETPVQGQDAGEAADKKLTITVADGAAAEILVPVRNAFGGDFEKKGAGELVLSESDKTHLFRVAVYDGTMTFKDTTFETAKFQQYPENAPQQATLAFDNATVLPINNNTLIGETRFHFKSVEVREGGLKLGFNTSYSPVGEIRLNHNLTGAGAVTKLEDATYDLRILMESSELLGGWNLLKGRTYVEYAAGLGTGPVSVQNNAVFYANRDMTIPNEIVLGPTAKFGPSGAAQKVAVESIGFTDDNTAKTVNLTVGLGEGVESRTVVLGGADKTVAAGGYRLENGVTLTLDGGTMQATGGAASPYVASANGAAVLNLGPKGGTIDTNGTDLKLGATLVVAPTDVVETCEPVAAENGSFEDGTAGWEFSGGNSGSNSGVYDNTSGFVAAFPGSSTTSGTKFAVVRPNGGFVQKTFTLPDDGEWKIVFELANRPDPAWDDGKLEWSLLIDDEVVREMAAESEKHTFKRYESPTFSVVAGEEHSFKIVTGPSRLIGGIAYDAFLIDAVRFEKVPVKKTVCGTLTKAGAGALELDGVETQGDLVVNAGSLVLSGGALANNAVTVKRGATLKFKDAVEVAIANASFEEGVDDTAVPNGFKSDANAIQGWTLERVSTNPNLGFSGWQRNGGIVSSNSDGSVFPRTTNGTHTAFLRPSSRMSTTVTIPVDGAYTLTFDHSARGGAGTVTWGYLLAVAVKLGDETICTLPARETANYDYRTVCETVELKAGTYTLAFETSDGGTKDGVAVETASGPMVFIDGISLVKTDLPRPQEENVVWNFEKGATLDIGSFDVELGTAFVDGVQVHGTKSAFTAAGLTVLGSGTLKSALSAPTIFIIR